MPQRTQEPPTYTRTNEEEAHVCKCDNGASHNFVLKGKAKNLGLKATKEGVL